MLKALDLPISKEQIDAIKEMETCYLKEDVIPLIEQEMEPLVEKIISDFHIEIKYSSEEGLSFFYVEQPEEECSRARTGNLSHSELGAVYRKKKFIVRVTFPDGYSVCHQVVANTMVEVIKRIGLGKVLRINDECFAGTLIKKAEEFEKGYSVKDLGDGYMLNVRADSDTKIKQLQTINKALNVGLKVEKVWL